MDEGIKERIIEIINTTKTNRAEFAKKINMTANHLSVVLNTESKKVSATMYKELSTIGINMNWLFNGEGGTWTSDPETTNKRIVELEYELKRANDLIDALERILKGK